MLPRVRPIVTQWVPPRARAMSYANIDALQMSVRTVLASGAGSGTPESARTEGYGRKGRELKVVPWNSTVYDATKLMVKHKIGSALVEDATGAVTGIVTERDYLRKVLHEGRTSHETTVGEIATMGADLYTVGLDDSLSHCIDIMDHKGFRHLPVKDNVGGSVVGLLSVKDITQALAERVRLQVRDTAMNLERRQRSIRREMSMKERQQGMGAQPAGLQREKSIKDHL